MSTGLLALLDDIGALVKVTAASLDDVSVQATKAGTKIAGVIIDDAAVTPKYVVGLSPKRELPIIWNITKGSFKNKLLFLTPVALLLGTFAPWIINPILAVGGTYLCFEGYEKLHHVAHKLLHKDTEPLADKIKKAVTISPEQLEKIRTNSAIRTDFILSAEIMAISYATVKDATFAVQVATLLFIAVAVTVCVYGSVAIIVKMDDIGLHLAKESRTKALRQCGRSIVKGMPHFLKLLSGIGTAAMLWVGGGIIIHAVPFLHHQFEHIAHMLHLEGGFGWSVKAVMSGVFGIAAGFVAAGVYKAAKRFLPSTKDKGHGV